MPSINLRGCQMKSDLFKVTRFSCSLLADIICFTLATILTNSLKNIIIPSTIILFGFYSISTGKPNQIWQRSFKCKKKTCTVL